METNCNSNCDNECNNISNIDADVRSIESRYEQYNKEWIENKEIELKRKRQEYNDLKRKLQKYENNFNKVFNEDQVRFVSSGSHRGVSWSDNTINKGLRLYVACGQKGYEEIRRQNLPYPSIRTLQDRLHGLTFKPGILYDVFRILKMKVSIFYGWYS